MPQLPPPSSRPFTPPPPFKPHSSAGEEVGRHGLVSPPSEELKHQGQVQEERGGRVYKNLPSCLWFCAAFGPPHLTSPDNATRQKTGWEGGTSGSNRGECTLVELCGRALY